MLAAEELIASKLFIARRERFDGADIAHVIYGTKGDLDWQRILRMAGEHWEMLRGPSYYSGMCIPAKRATSRKRFGVT